MVLAAVQSGALPTRCPILIHKPYLETTAKGTSFLIRYGVRNAFEQPGLIQVQYIYFLDLLAPATTGTYCASWAKSNGCLNSSGLKSVFPFSNQASGPLILSNHVHHNNTFHSSNASTLRDPCARICIRQGTLELLLESLRTSAGSKAHRPMQVRSKAG